MLPLGRDREWVAGLGAGERKVEGLEDSHFKKGSLLFSVDIRANIRY